MKLHRISYIKDYKCTSRQNKSWVCYNQLHNQNKHLLMIDRLIDYDYDYDVCYVCIEIFLMSLKSFLWNLLIFYAAKF